jgi:hypothetical protein
MDQYKVYSQWAYIERPLGISTQIIIMKNRTVKLVRCVCGGVTSGRGRVNEEIKMIVDGRWTSYTSRK